jgi:hypothetical protein
MDFESMREVGIVFVTELPRHSFKAPLAPNQRESALQPQTPNPLVRRNPKSNFEVTLQLAR